jgi:hypothetical protein
MPLDKGCKGRFVPMLDEAAQELPIGQTSPVLPKHSSAKVLDDLARQVGRHVGPRQVSPPSTYYLPPGGTLMHDFF